ncbi:MAG: hypothetical protein ACRC0G_07425 [Fusobacteriaceae bacterium]
MLNTASMRNLGNTELYKALDGGGNPISKAIMATVISGRKVSLNGDLPEAYERISRFAFPNRVDVINAVADGTIQIVIGTGKEKVPPFITNYTIKSANGEFISYADITMISSVNADNKIKVNDKELYAVLSSAYITHCCYKNWGAMRTMALKEPLAKSYGKLMLKVFNRLFSLSANTINLEKVLYCVHKFYYLNVLGFKDSTENINSTCMKMTETINSKIVSDIDNYVTDKDYATLKTFLEALATNIPVCAKLTQSGFMNSWVSMYGSGSVFAIEFLPAYLTIIDYVMTGSYLTINTGTVERIIDKQASEIYRLMNAAMKDHSR